MESQKKICIISMGNLYLVPYLSLYTNKIDTPYSIIYWDRENMNEQYENAQCHRFSYKIKNKYDKIIGFYKYRKFIKEELNSKKYERVIMLQTIGALLINDILIKKYSKKYIVDIRDYTYEYNKLVYIIEKRLLKNSALNVVSSEGYLSFLPPNIDYVIAHNIRAWSQEKIDTFSNNHRVKKKLNIAFIGYVNYQEQHKKLLLALKNDNRLHITFIGTRSEELREFCDSNDIRNVTLLGSFESAEILELYKNVDLINNLYGNNTPILDYALSNKLYYAAQLKIPILVCENTFMEKVANRYGIGITVDLQKRDISNYILEQYNNINWDEFDQGCEKFLIKVNEQQKKLENNIYKILK